MKLKVKYLGEHFEESIGRDEKSIVLLGTVSFRYNWGDVKWYKTALRILKRLKFKGTVYVPFERSGRLLLSYEEKVKWLFDVCYRATAIVFWNNIEMTKYIACSDWLNFGKYCLSGEYKVFYGRSENTSDKELLDLPYLNVYQQKGKIYKHLKKLLKDAAVYASEDRVFGMSLAEIAEMQREIS